MLLQTKDCKRCGSSFFRPTKISQKQWRELYSNCNECTKYMAKHEKSKLMIQARWGNHIRKTKVQKKMIKYKIAFVWQGVSDETIKDKWQDGLRYAMDKIAKKHTVHFFEPWQDINGYDVILYWEAPVTAQGQNAPHYNKVRQNPTKKILLFAGGQIQKQWVDGFDMLFLESKINEKECDDLGIKWHHAFGVNNKKFSDTIPTKTNRLYDGMLHGTCASWKRQWLIGEAFGPRGLVIGRGQDSDPYPFNRCKELGAVVLPDSPPGIIKQFMRESHALVNCCDYWGGGQRATLEAMAVGLPVVCCNDSPKNMEFIQESGFGKIVEPNAQAIKQAVEDIKANPMDPRIGIKYVKEKWSGDVYAKQLLEGIKKIVI